MIKYEATTQSGYVITVYAMDEAEAGRKIKMTVELLGDKMTAKEVIE